VNSNTAFFRITANPNDPVDQKTTGFDIQYVSVAPWQAATLTYQPSNNYDISGLTPNTTYYIRARTRGQGVTGPLVGPYTILYQFQTPEAPAVATLGSFTVSNVLVTTNSADFTITNLPAIAPESYLYQVREQGLPDPVLTGSSTSTNITIPLSAFPTPTASKIYQLWVIGLKPNFNSSPATYCPFATASPLFGAP
jgi:hypothetical protein